MSKRSIIQRIFYTIILVSIISHVPLAKSNKERDQDYFNLVIYGKNLNNKNMKILLRNNITTGEQWDTLVDGAHQTNQNIRSSENLLIIRGLSMQKYFGQDIRENYVAIRMRTLTSQSKVSVSAFYILSSWKSETSIKLLDQIKNSRLQNNKNCIGKLIRTKPYSLHAKTYYTEHIEAPVRHLKPGIQEVKWLEMIFQNR